MADRQHTTVRGLLTGQRDTPLCGIEAGAWAAYKRWILSVKRILAEKDPPQELIAW